MKFVDLYNKCKLLKHSDFYSKNPLGVQVEYTYRMYIPSHPDILTFLCNDTEIIYYNMKTDTTTNVETNIKLK